MQQISRLSFAAAFVIVLLRMAIGYHFFKEGESKIRDGEFSSAGFFRQSKGELSPFFKGLLADEDAKFRLCYAPHEDDGTDPTLTYEYWEEFGRHVAAKCRTLEQTIVSRRNDLRAEIDRRRRNDQSLGDLEKRYREDEQAILTLRAHIESIGPTIGRHMDEFDLFLAGYEEEIRNYFRSLERLEGFERDGDARGDVVEGVASLNSQRNTIYSDIQKERAPLIAQVEASWNALEKELNDVDVEEYQSSGDVLLPRPYEKRPMMRLVDNIVPWHHVVIGCLIFFGLFCRWASLLGAFFLLLICACQLPWATGATPIYYQLVEMIGLLALAAIGAGRYAGLDYFIDLMFKSNTSSREGALNESHA